MMLDIKRCILLVIVMTGGVTYGKTLGDICTIESTGEIGVCRPFVDCREGHKEISNNPIYFKKCGLSGNEKTICCPMGKEPILQRIKKETKPEREPGAISKEKCKEYSKYVTESQKSPELITDKPEVNKNECAHQTVRTIIGGVRAQEKEFPHMAVISFEQTFENTESICGGSIISERYILTAAHCLHSRQHGDPKYVQVGISNINEKNDRKQQIKISDCIPHPQYKRKYQYHDIGLLKLETAINMNPFARPACLYSDNYAKSDLTIATGWGRSWYDEDAYDYLLKATLHLIDYDSCNNHTGLKNQPRIKKGIVDETQICAASLNFTVIKDSWRGDSGCPLQIQHDVGDGVECMYDIMGIASFGKACSETPGVYTRVSHYIKWIEDIVWA